MKKLLSMLAVSTLSVTSASNLKPLFTSNVVVSVKDIVININVKIVETVKLHILNIKTIKI